MKIKFQLFLIFSLLIVATIGIMTFITITELKSSIIESEITYMANHISEKEIQLQNLHSRASEDLVFVLQNQIFEEYFELPETKSGNNYKDGVMQFTDRQRELKSQMEKIMYSFQNKFDVDETCLIDTTGQEHTRVVLKKLAPDDELSNEETKTPFFAPAFSKNKNEVHVQSPYVSPDTNRWVFAYASPVVLGDGQRDAIYHFEMPIGIFQSLIQSDDKGRMFVLDPQGYLIADSAYHYSDIKPSYEFTKYFPPITEIFPLDKSETLLQQIKSQTEGALQYQSEDGHTYHVVYKKLPTFGWYILYQESEENMMSEYHTEAGNIFAVIVIVASLIVIISMIVVMALSNKITRPIVNLKDATKSIARGIFDIEFKNGGSGEIAELEKSFSKMIGSLKKTVELEKQLAKTEERIKNERLTAIGQLAGQISHDLRNPLSSIRQSIEIIKTNSPDPSVQKETERIKRSVKRMNHQINDVLNFLRNTPLRIERKSIKHILNSIISVLDVPQNITILVPENDVQIDCDRIKLDTVFANILLNAIQAIGGQSGKIWISLSEEQNEMVKIQIKNSGPPIPEHNLDKIFEPLFTTKEKGTGLGLTSCKNIIEQHKGIISVEPSPVVFSILLPKEQNPIILENT